LPVPVQKTISLLSPDRGTSDVLDVAYFCRDEPENANRKGPRALMPKNQPGDKKSMGEISDLLQQRAGLSPDKAQEVEQVVVEYVKSKVPSEFQGMLGSVLGEGSGSADAQPAESGGLGSLLGAASSLFGNKG